MTKYEFLYSLEEALNGAVNENEKKELMDYYEKYINQRVNEGDDLQQVIDSLGDPRLLVKSIEIANRGRSTQSSFGTDYREYNSADGYLQPTPGEKGEVMDKGKKLRTYAILGVFGVGTVVVVGAVLKLLSFFAPVLVILFIVYLIRRRVDR